jgi:hypothetical protein
MTVPVVLAVAGVIALLAGILGGGIKMRDLEIPSMPKTVRIPVCIIGAILVGIAILLFIKPNGWSLTLFRSPSNTKTFLLEDAESEDFQRLRNATLRFDDGKLFIKGDYKDGIYLTRSLPTNFRATVKFRTENASDNFIVGLNNGETMRPNFHFVMTSKWTAFKEQLGPEVKEEWDHYLDRTEISSYLLRPRVNYEIEFERKNGGVIMSINNVMIFGFGAPDVEGIGRFNYLYLTGAIEQEVIIEDLVIEKIE